MLRLLPPLPWGIAVAAALSACAASGAGSSRAPEARTTAPESQRTDAAKPAGADAQTPPAPGAQTMGAADARAFAAFNERLKTYVALHEKLEKTLPDLPKEATPQQIDTHQRALTKLIQGARRDAKAGDIFVPSSRAAIRRMMERIYTGPEGRALLASTMDENPVALKVKVNDRYPDSVPLSTVPPQVLHQLPQLPEEIEFRFIGRDLILLDVHAHMIVDIVEKAIPL